jgi:two-component system alkaline phosphatase synthesis response regulator PhoP/two-component system response regulator ResD
MPREPRILVVEDDARIRRELLDSLRTAGFDVDVAVSFRDASISSERDYALVVLDLGLPDGDGLDLVRLLRERGRGVPILILTARDTPDSRVRGLDAGADDYVVKPFHMPELVARVRSLLRRSGRSVGTGLVRHGNLWIDPETRKAGKDEAAITLKPREFDLLLFLMQHPGRTWTRDQLLDRVWGAAFTGDARTVDLHVRRLRAKIEDDSSDPHFIETVWGVGYRMAEPHQVR